MAEDMHDPDDLTRANALRRSVELMARPTILDEHEFADEPHRRGEVVVAAFMSAFVKVWADRLARLGSPGGTFVDRELAAEQGAVIADLLDDDGDPRHRLHPADPHHVRRLPQRAR